MANKRQQQSFTDLLIDHVEVTLKLTSLDIAVGFIQENLEPEDVFSENQLVAWAEANGYVKSEE